MKRKFRFEEERFSDHQFLSLYLDGRKRVQVKVPNIHAGSDAIGDKILGSMASKCEVNLAFFKRMIGCREDCESYYRHLSGRGQ